MDVMQAPAFSAAKLKNVEDIYPMSPMQQGILFHSLFEQGTGLYFLGMGCRIEGPLDVPAFRRAWEEVIRRHATLRSSLVWEGLNRPRQVVRKTVELPWHEEDWRSSSTDEQKKNWETFLAMDRREGFDFKRAPLLRLALMRTGEQSYYFSWASHHVLLDGWARQIVMGEVFTLYEAYRKDRAPELARPHLYREYVCWLQEQHEKAAETFWRAELAGFYQPTRLGIELDGSVQDGTANEHGVIEACLSREETLRLEQLCRDQMITLSTLIRMGWALLLRCYSGEDDIVFGATVSGRSGGNSRFEQTVGLFINTLPVRVRFTRDERVTDCLKRLQQWHARMLDYEHSRLPKVQEWSDIPRGTALFDTIVVFENYPLDAAVQKVPDSSLKFSQIGTLESTSYRMGLVVRPGRELSFACLYSRRWFSRSSVERLLQQLFSVLVNISSDATESISKISLLREAERRQLANGWSGPPVTRSRRSIGALVASHAERIPDALAVVSDGRTLTYRELNRMANQWAKYVKAHGIRQGQRVALCLEPSAEMVAVALGILKAGMVLVGLDSDEPAMRRARMLERSHATLLITENRLAENSSSRPPLLFIEEHRGAVEQQNGEEPRAEVEMASAACVLYRSTPGGELAGVVLPQRALCGSASPEPHAGEKDGERVAYRLSFAHEAESIEWWRALARGECVVNVSGEMAPRKLASVLREQKVTTLWARTAMLERLARDFPWALKNVREIVCEEQNSVLWGLRERLPAEVLQRAYGVSGYTEAGGCIMKYPLADIQKPGSIRFDYLAADVSMYLLDDQMQPVAEGALGEIYLSGEALALGYEQNGQPNEDAFPPLPCYSESKGKMYRTGERARREQGFLQFEGSRNTQTVIAGKRIRSQEIESVLLEHPQIQQAAVLIGEDEKIRAFVTSSTRAFDSAELLKFVKERLHSMMAPAEITVIEAIPPGKDGRVDRMALLQKVNASANAAAYAEPGTELEQKLASIWAETLGVDQIGIHDNFFSLGGNSLLIMQMVWKIRELLGVEMPINKFFESPTIADLGRAIEQIIGPEMNWQLGASLQAENLST
jgi:non-ribosomal peptide synthetase component F/acyl carrier protein